MNRQTAQKLLQQHFSDTQTVPWLNENTDPRAFPFSAALLQFVLNEGTDRQNINRQCYVLTALLGQVATHLQHADLSVQSEVTIKAVVQRSVALAAIEHQDTGSVNTLATALGEQLSDWSENGTLRDLPALWGETLTLVAQTLYCVNHHKAWQEPQVTLLEACEQAVAAPHSDWQIEVMRALEDDTWGEKLQTAARTVLNPSYRLHNWPNFSTTVQSYLKQKCYQCYEPGSIRYSCGEYAGRYCDEHWESAGYRPANDRLDYQDAGEYATEGEAY